MPDWEGAGGRQPRFGSWGREVELCKDEISFRRHLRSLEQRLWFQQHGALLQELVPPAGADLRILVAAGVAVGAISRRAAPGEWRTNIALGGTRVPVEPPAAALELAIRAAEAAGADLIGVDLLPDGRGGHTVLELNGAVDFTREYRLDRDPFVAAAAELTRHAWEPEEAVGLSSQLRHETFTFFSPPASHPGSSTLPSTLPATQGRHMKKAIALRPSRLWCSPRPPRRASRRSAGR